MRPFAQCFSFCSGDMLLCTGTELPGSELEACEETGQCDGPRFFGHRCAFLPLERSAFYTMVSKRLTALDLRATITHHGPHSLRHACAARLVAEGLSLKEIGDHLGHRSTAATRIYAKVDLLGLREVAAFDLGELS